jgi:hypothetical protein
VVRARLRWEHFAIIFPAEQNDFCFEIELCQNWSNFLREKAMQALFCLQE